MREFSIPRSPSLSSLPSSPSLLRSLLPDPLIGAHLMGRLLATPGDARAIIGIVGAPGAGKSTLARKVADAVGQLMNTAGEPKSQDMSRGVGQGGQPGASIVAVVPMDGYHLADVELDRQGKRNRKGAIDTFDAYGYLALLGRLRVERANPVYAPAFERDLEQPISGAIMVPPEVRIILTEGNYLLDADAPWPAVRAACDEIWYVETDDDLRRSRLIARHVEFGKTPAAARAWVDAVDEPNARRIKAQREDADLIIRY